MFMYEINENSLNRETSSKDLGILFNAKLSFVEHSNIILSKSCKMYGFIIKIADR